jgi:hypothetical protein
MRECGHLIMDLLRGDSMLRLCLLLSHRLLQQLHLLLTQLKCLLQLCNLPHKSALFLNMLFALISEADHLFHPSVKFIQLVLLQCKNLLALFTFLLNLHLAGSEPVTQVSHLIIQRKQ